MTFEQLLGETLHAADGFAPSPDLFAKVQRSIAEDAAHRDRVRRLLLWITALVATVIVYLVATVTVGDRGVTMPFGALEVLVTALMIVIVAVLGPAIRRFGETYERSVFAGSPETGTQVLRLLDIAYYLIFGAYILMTLLFEHPLPDPSIGHSAPTPEFSYALLIEAERLGGLLLLMAVLHVVLLLALPVVGIVNAANQRRARIADGATSDDDVAGRIDRAVTVGVWVIAIFVLLELVVGVLGIVASLGASG